MNLRVSRDLIPPTVFYYLHDIRANHSPRAFRVRKDVRGEIEVRRELVLKYDRNEEYSSSRERLREQAERLVDIGIIRVDLGQIDKAPMREKAGIYRQCVADGGSRTGWFYFEQAWSELVKAGYLDEDGVIQPKFYRDHRSTNFGNNHSLQAEMQAAKKYFLVTDKLRVLPLNRDFCKSLDLRGTDLSLATEARHQAHVDAILGRFADRLEDVAEFIPTAENFYSLAGHFLKMVSLYRKHPVDQPLLLRYSQLAEECFQEAEKYELNPEWRRTCQSFIRNNTKMGHQAGELLFLMRDILSRRLALNNEDALAAFERFDQEYLGKILESIKKFRIIAIDIPGIGSGKIIEEYDEDVLTVIYAARLAASFARSSAELFDNLDKLIDFIRQLRAGSIIERPYLLAFQKLVEEGTTTSPQQLVDLIRIELTQRGKALVAPLGVLADNPPCPEGHLVDAITTGSIDQPVPLAEFLSTRPTFRMLSSYEEVIISAFGYTKKGGVSESERSWLKVGDEWLNSLKTIRGFFIFLAEHQAQPWAYINALLLFAKRFPEYQKKLNEILEREKANILDLGHAVRPAIVPAELSLGFEIPPQPVPLIEHQLAERALPEEFANGDLPDPWRPAVQLTTKKCLVLDADETLWGGIIDEEGVEGIRPNVEFQRRIKALKDKGVVLALNTRNTPEAVAEAFAAHAMPLKLEDFAVVRANFEPKANNIAEIACELNLGIDSIVFLDDSPQERELVSRAHPKVFVPSLPLELGFYAGFLEGMSDLFDQGTVTEEDRQRTKLYAARQQADALQEQVVSREDGLQHLGMKVKITVGSAADVPRLAQLSRRTNQFNLTTRRYSEEDIVELLEGPEVDVFSMRLIDKFADHGLVGLIIVKRTGNEAEIDTFAMSCRALARTAEQTFMAEVARQLRSTGVKRLRGLYIPSARNQRVENLYAELGFTKVGEAEGATSWEIDLTTKMIKPSDFCTIV